MAKPVGVLIDDIVSKKRDKGLSGFIDRHERNGKKQPYHFRLNRIIACIRILRDRGMVVYYKEDE